MIGARSLEIGTSIALNEGVFADEHRIKQGCLLWWPQCTDFCNDARVSTAAPEFHAIAAKAGQQLHVFGLGGAQSCNAIFSEIVFVVERSWIAEVPG